VRLPTNRPRVAVAATGHVGSQPAARVVAPMHESCRWPAVTHAGAWSLVAVCSAGGGAGAGGCVGCPGCLWRRLATWARSRRFVLSRRRVNRAAGQLPALPSTVRRWRRARPPEGPEQAGGRPPQVAVAPTGHVGPQPLASVVEPAYERAAGQLPRVRGLG